MGSSFYMSDVSRVKELLAQAVQCLDGQQPQDSSCVRGSGHTGQAPSAAQTSTSPFCSSFPSRLRTDFEASSSRAALVERNCLFNFSSSDRKRKGKGVPGSRSKKKTTNMWVHECICLSRTNQDKTPTAMERAALISSGAVYVCTKIYNTNQLYHYLCTGLGSKKLSFF